MFTKKLMVAALSAMVAIPGIAAAEETAHGGYVELGESRDWTAIQFSSPAGDGKMACAIFSRPKSSRVIEGTAEVDALRGEKAAFITWDSGVEVSTNTGVASFLMGAPVVPKDAGHQLTIDAEKEFDLYGFEDRVYTRETDDDDVIKGIRKGRTMAVRVKISNTRDAEDQYSLYGVQAATNLAAQACN